MATKDLPPSARSSKAPTRKDGGVVTTQPYWVTPVGCNRVHMVVGGCRASITVLLLIATTAIRRGSPGCTGSETQWIAGDGAATAKLLPAHSATSTAVLSIARQQRYVRSAARAAVLLRGGGGGARRAPRHKHAIRRSLSACMRALHRPAPAEYRTSWYLLDLHVGTSRYLQPYINAAVLQ